MPACADRPAIDDLRPRQPGDALDRADGEPFVLEQRALLDVQLEIRVRPEPAGLRVAGIADAPQLVADGGAVDAADRVGVVERKRAGIDQAAHRIGLEAHALLVGEGDQRQRAAGGGAGVGERLAGLEPGEHAVEAVVAAAGPDRVDVRAEHHRSAGPRGLGARR